MNFDYICHLSLVADLADPIGAAIQPNADALLLQQLPRQGVLTIPGELVSFILT